MTFPSSIVNLFYITDLTRNPEFLSLFWSISGYFVGKGRTFLLVVWKIENHDDNKIKI